MSTFNELNKTVPRKYGLILFVVFTAFFLIMRFAGLGHIYWLRSLNIIILLVGILGAIRSYKANSDANVFEDFFDFFKIAMRTALIGIGLFAIALALYLDLIDKAFMAELQEMESFGGLISPVSVSFLIFFEGMGSAFLCSYVGIQLLKTRTVEKPVDTKEEHRKEFNSSK